MSKETIKNMLNSIINGNDEEAQSQLHAVLQSKMQAVVNPKKENTEQLDSEILDTQETAE